MTKLHEKIRNLRRAKNLTLENIAAEIDIDYSTYHSYEKDASKIQVKTLEKLSKFYNVPLSEFFSDSGQKQDGNYMFEPSAPYQKSSNGLKVIIELDGIDSHLKSWFLKLEKINAVLS